MEIKNQIKTIEDELIQLRRYFHENPEKSWEEHNTQKKSWNIWMNWVFRTLLLQKPA